MPGYFSGIRRCLFSMAWGLFLPDPECLPAVAWALPRGSVTARMPSRSFGCGMAVLTGLLSPAEALRGLASSVPHTTDAGPEAGQLERLFTAWAGGRGAPGPLAGPAGQCSGCACAVGTLVPGAPRVPDGVHFHCHGGSSTWSTQRLSPAQVGLCALLAVSCPRTHGQAADEGLSSRRSRLLSIKAVPGQAHPVPAGQGSGPLQASPLVYQVLLGICDLP